MTKESHRWIVALLLSISQSLVAQNKPSTPLPEAYYRAGADVHVVVMLKNPLAQAMRVYGEYQSVNTDQIPEGQLGSFTCGTDVDKGALSVELLCRTPRNLRGGNYASSSGLIFYRLGTSENRTITGLRLPQLTILPNPSEVTRYPDLAGSILKMDGREALIDASTRGQILFDDLARSFPGLTPSTEENRASLREYFRRARVLLTVTQNRYSYGTSSVDPGVKVAPLPVFLQDFERRLEVISHNSHLFSQIAPTTNQGVALVAAKYQLPHTTETIQAKDRPTGLDAVVQSLGSWLSDYVKAAAGISESGVTVFTWSATTIPAGATVWVSRLGEPEQKLAGLTNLTDQKLEYAIWTFRFDWDGCSQKETPNPYLQNSLKLQVSRAGCKKKP